MNETTPTTPDSKVGFGPDSSKIVRDEVTLTNPAVPESAGFQADCRLVCCPNLGICREQIHPHVFFYGPEAENDG